MNRIIKKVQVNIPFTMLWESYLERFVKNGLNPEIGFDAASLDRYTSREFRSIAGVLLERGLSITVHGPFMDLSPGSPDPAVRAITRHRFEQILPAVAALRPKTVVCHTGFDRKRYETIKTAWIEHSLEFWHWFGGCLRDEGSRLMLENVYEKEPDELLVLLKALESPGVGFCFDIGHQNAFGKAAVGTWLETLGPFLREIHLHDNNGDADQHLAPGKGRADFQTLFEFLKSSGIEQPILTMEPHREKDLDPGLRFLERAWPW
jgi:sugar phosphate isomerase/epimerase